MDRPAVRTASVWQGAQRFSSSGRTSDWKSCAAALRVMQRRKNRTLGEILSAWTVSDNLFDGLCR